MANVEFIPCPYCRSESSTEWATENGYHAVKCHDCGFVYVNPRPVNGLIAEAVETGVHTTLGGHNVVGRRHPSKVSQFKKLLSQSHADVWKAGRPISWLDVGAGFGEVVEAVRALAPAGSRVAGLEPMEPKAQAARAIGLEIINGYLPDVTEKFEFASLINVFSHIPDFRSFLAELKSKLTEGGEFWLITGNAGELERASEVPSNLDLPDHLVFAGRRHLIGLLEEAGFEIKSVKERRTDTPAQWAKNVVKKVIGRPTNVVTPYTSPYRDLTIRAKLAT